MLAMEDLEKDEVLHSPTEEKGKTSFYLSICTYLSIT